MSATTLADVARAVGVSTAAASLALNGKPGVSEDTRTRVHEIAARLGYQPNPAGRALRQSRIGSIGLYLPRTAVHFGYYSEVTSGIAETLHDAGSSVTLLPNVAHGLRLEAFPRVDGFILIEPHNDDPGVAEILSQPLPVVSGDRPPPGTGQPWGLVESPNEKTVRLVFDRFLTAGAERPGLLQIERVSEWSIELERHYLDWCAERGIQSRIASISIHDTNERLTEQLREFFDENVGCDAILAAGDEIAMRIAGILRTLGKSLGSDVRLISGVDSQMMAFHTPSISAIDLQPRLFGRCCADLALALVECERPAEPLRRVVPSPLIERESG